MERVVKKVKCVECGKRHVPRRPVAECPEGVPQFVCGPCWNRLGYDRYMSPELTPEDEHALARARTGTGR